MSWSSSFGPTPGIVASSAWWESRGLGWRFRLGWPIGFDVQSGGEVLAPGVDCWEWAAGRRRELLRSSRIWDRASAR